MNGMPSALAVLNKEVINCTRCPRLVAYREQIGREKRRAYRDHEYWARPVPGFGDPKAHVLVMGLAPRSPWLESYRPAIYRRCLRQVHVSHPLQGGIREPA